MDLYFMRHGESTADLENKIESRYDAELTERGCDQAVQAAAYFKSKGIVFNKIISSPLKRALMTAEQINISQNCPLYIDPDLAEVDRGILCGLERKEADSRYPRKDYRTHYDLYPEGSGESAFMVRSRANRVLQNIMGGDDETILIVSHGAFLNRLLSELFMMPDHFNDETGTLFAFRDCEYIHIRKKPERDKYIVLEKLIPNQHT